MEPLRFPSKLTEEEKMLKAKYALLKEKKKALQSSKTSQPEHEIIPSTYQGPMEAKFATSLAKKLIKSGNIPAITKKTKSSEKATFKRSITLERKLKAAKIVAGTSKSFSMDCQPGPSYQEPEPGPSGMRKTVYKPSISVQDWEEASNIKNSNDQTDKICRENTICVEGHNITRDYLKKSFQSCGRIVNVDMGEEKHCGFVTFDKDEAASRAVSEINGCMASGIQLNVSLARKQPQSKQISHFTNTDWHTINGAHVPNGKQGIKRDMLVYENTLFD